MPRPSRLSFPLRPALVAACAGLVLALAPTAGRARVGRRGVNAFDAPVTLPAGADAYVDASRPRASLGTTTCHAGRVLAGRTAPTSASRSRPRSLPGARNALPARLRDLEQPASRCARSLARPGTKSRLLWASAPALAASPAAVASGALQAGTWKTVDVTTLVAGAPAGDLALAVTAQSRLSFATRESGSPPRLVLEPATSCLPSASGPRAEPLRPRDRRFDRVGLRRRPRPPARRLPHDRRRLDPLRHQVVGRRADARVAELGDLRPADRRRERARPPRRRDARLHARLGAPGGDDDKYPPTTLADYTRFARAAVARYAPLGVKHYEIWNEPNIDGFWKPAPDAARYTELLKAAYAEMKQADPSITVLAGAFSPAGGYRDPSCGGGPTAERECSSTSSSGCTRTARRAPSTRSHTIRTGTPRTRHLCAAWNQLAGTSDLAAQPDGRQRRLRQEDLGDRVRLRGDQIGEQTQADQLAAGIRLWLATPWAGELMVYSYKQALEGFNLVRPTGRRAPRGSPTSPPARRSRRLK